MKQNKKAKICFVIHIAGERKLFFYIYDVIVKPKKKSSANLYSHTHTYMHACIHTYDTYIQAHMHACMHIRAYISIYIHTSQIDFIDMDMVCPIYIMSHICMSHMVHDR